MESPINLPKVFCWAQAVSYGTIRPSVGRKWGVREAGGRSGVSGPHGRGSSVSTGQHPEETGAYEFIVSTNMPRKKCGKRRKRVDSWLKILRKEVCGRERQKKGKQSCTLLYSTKFL